MPFFVDRGEEKMSEKAVKLRNLEAVQTPDLVGSEYKLSVTGEAFVPTTNTKAHFEEKKPPGINPTVLLLDLIETAEGIGGQIFVWTKIEPFQRRISSGQYRHVGVFFKGEKVETVEVTKVLS